jgi:peptidoglycan/xylan/chitin deacetylase (PgdA/CDA1 family)
MVRAVTDALVLCYHALSPTWSAALSTTPARFERQLELLLGQGRRGVTFADATRAKPGERVLAVTFDDAYRSVIELAAPILERHGVPATVFAPTDYIGSERAMRWEGIEQWLGGADEPELVPMSWPELRELAARGWEIGSHTCSHPHLTRIGEEQLADELARSKSTCEREMGAPCGSLAYPYGDVDGRVVAAAARAGYETAAALPSRLDARGPLQWPRIGVYNADDELRFRVKVSPPLRALRRTRAWESLGALRGLARRA